MFFHDNSMTSANIEEDYTACQMFCGAILRVLDTATLKTSGRPPKLSSHDKRATTWEIRRDSSGCSQVQHELGLTVFKTPSCSRLKFTELLRIGRERVFHLPLPRIEFFVYTRPSNVLTDQANGTVLLSLTRKLKLDVLNGVQ